MKTLLSAIVLLVGLSTSAFAEERTITVNGQGTVETAPDMATVTLGVTRTAPEAGEALDATSEAVAEVIARLEDLNIAPQDMQTSGLNLQPIWSREVKNGTQSREITGFSASNQLTVRVRELNDLGVLLDAVVQEGANTFAGLRFSLQDPASALADARAAAVRDAMMKAGQIADAAEVTLGPVLSITENGGMPRPVNMEMSTARMSDSVPVVAGEVSLSVSVSMRFAIAD